MSSVSESSAKPEVFVRKASGLVRTAGTWDVLAYNFSFVGIGTLMLFLLLFGPSFYPGTSMELSIVMCGLLVLPLALVFAYLASTMPRSGGDYVYVSRVLGPAWGMMSNFNATMWWFFYGGLPSAYLAQYGLAPFFRVLGIFTGNTGLFDIGNWFATPWGMFTIGALLIAGLVYVFARGMRLFFRIQNVVMVIGLFTLAVTAIVLIGKTPVDFAAAFNNYVGDLANNPDLYNYVLTAGEEAGFTNPGFSFSATALLMTWVFYNVGFMQGSAYIGSEVKDARRLQLWSMPATLLAIVVINIVIVFLVRNAVGYDFLGAVSWVDPAALGMQSTPVFTEMAAYLGGSLIVALIITIGFIYWSCSWEPCMILNGSRNLLAYAIDGLLPGWFRKVHPRLHTPVNSLLFMGGASIVALAIFVFTPWFATLVGLFGYLLSFTMVSIAAILLPYRLPDVFETSTVNRRIGGVPVISIIGVLSVIGCVILGYVFLKDSGSGLTPGMIALNVGVLLSGLVIYYVAKAIQARRGIDVTLSYKELPKE